MEIVFLGREHNVTHREVAFSYNFRILDNWDKSETEILLELIKNKNFLQGIKDRRVGSVFNYELVRSEDFATFNKQNLYKYLDDYFNNTEWTEYHIEDIKSNVAWLKKDIEKYSSGNFFVLNMALFEETSKIVRQSKRSMYPYYFVAIFWFDRENCIVTYAELFLEILAAEIIKQYVDLAIKERKECLEYQRVRDEWKLTQTHRAVQKVIEQKDKHKKALFERAKVQFVLMANGIIGIIA